MKYTLACITLGCLLASTSTYAADTQAPESAKTAQQNKMKTCNAEAKTQALKGDARKEFMSNCLSTQAAPTAAAPESAKTAQQNKMKTCNAEAKTKALKGDERKQFMSACLSAK